jgi:hypothetical protein
MTQLLLTVLFLGLPIALLRASDGMRREAADVSAPEEAVGNPEKAVQALSRCGHARFVRDSDRRGAPVIGVTLRGAADADLHWLAALPHLKTLEIESDWVTDRGLKAVGKARGLREVRLDCPRLTHKGLLELRSLARLRTLHFHHFPTIDDQLLLEKALPGLTILPPRCQTGYREPAALAP